MLQMFVFALAPEALEVTPKDHHHKTYENEKASVHRNGL